MTKKEYVMKMLYGLKEHRNLAPMLISRMENNEIDDEGILALYDMLAEAVDKVADKKLKEKLTNSMLYLKKLQQMEEQASKEEEDELKDLEDLIQSA